VPKDFHATGKHIGDGWVQLSEGAHPVILSRIRHLLVLLPEAASVPVGRTVRFAFQLHKNKNCLKMVGYHIASY